MGVSQWAETHGALPHLLVLGAGPVGLETAVAALSQGWRVTVLERGAQPGQNVRDWLAYTQAGCVPLWQAAGRLLLIWTSSLGIIAQCRRAQDRQSRSLDR